MIKNVQTILLAVLAALVIVHETQSFSILGHNAGRKVKSSTSKMAWSLQMPDVPFPKSTWYNEVGNPTARRIVYEE